MNSLAIVSFTTPWMWAGLGLISLPVIAHFLNRYARSRRVYPSLQLLSACVAEHAKVWNIRRWILLLLRCLAIFALVAAFSRPVWQANQAAAQAARQTNGVVLLIDVSASMQVTRGGVRLIDVAKAAADRILGDLRSGTDLAEIVYVSNRAESVFGELSPNLPALKRSLKSADIGWSRANMIAGIDHTAQLLRGFRGMRRVIVLSDLQATSWQQVLDQRALQERLPERTRVTIIDLKTPVVANLSINSPRCDPTIPVVGQTANVTAVVTNHATETHQVRVSAFLDAKELPAATVQVDGGQQREVTFACQLDDLAHHSIEFRLQSDLMPRDDRCFAVAQAHAQLAVTLLSDDAPSRPDTASYYLTRALAPHDNQHDRFHVQHLAPAEFTRSTLPQGAVFVAYLSRMDETLAKALEDFVRTGGALIIFCGEGPVQQNLEILDRHIAGGWLPWTTGNRVRFPPREELLRIEKGQWRHRLLSDFDTISQMALSRIRFGRVWQVKDVKIDSDVLLSFSPQLPALALRAHGDGQVVLVNFSPEDETSGFGGYGGFVALTQILAQNLIPATEADQLTTVGDSIVRVYTDVNPSTIAMVAPSGKSLRPTLTVHPSSTAVHLLQAEEPGIYGVDAPDRPLDRIPVNLDPAESRLGALPISDVRKAIDSAEQSAAIENQDAWEGPIDLDGKPLWGWMMLLACGMLGLEMGLLACWRR